MDKNNIKISACILTRNDNQFIEQCIQNIVLYVDEIVVLDANDDNETENIIKNIKIPSSKYIIYKKTSVSKNFAKDRNELQSIATGDYVIHVDCDEIFDPNLLSSMKYIISDYLSRNILPLLFRFPRINQPDKINYPDYQIRLLNKKYTKWTRKVHEVPEIIPIDKEEVGMTINNLITLNCPITHLYKDKNELQKRWKDLLYNTDNNRKLLVLSIFRNSKIWIGKTLQCMNNLYSYNQKIDDEKKLNINFSFIDINSDDGTFEILENFSREGYILNVQLRRLGPSYTIKNDAIGQSVTGFPLKDDDYILFADNNIEFEENIVHDLIKDMEDLHADIIAPMIYTGKELYFYDTISFRLLDGSCIGYHSPYRIDMSKPNEISSVGSFYIMRYNVAKNIKYSAEIEDNVEFCRRARSQGFKLFIDPRLGTYHI